MDELMDGRLWMGGYAAATKHGPRMDVVVTLTRYHHGVLEEALGEAEGVEWVRWPIRDGPLPELEELHDVAEQAAEAVGEGRKVLVHCASGINRSGLVSALVVREVNRLSGPSALQMLDRKTEQAVLRNDRFRSYIEGLGQP